MVAGAVFMLEHHAISTGGYAMMRWPKVLFVLAGFLLASGAPTQAQDYIHVDGWYEVMHVKFRPACARRALQIIHGHFVKVDKTVGRQVLPFDFQTGEWDHVVYFPIALSEEGYDTIPPRSEWWAALYEQEGGKEQGDRLFGEFLDCIVQSRTEIARLVLETPSAE
jgi:hypothetical protein